MVLSGRTASGKSTIAQRAADLAGVAHASFGDYVRHLAGVGAKGETARRKLQEVGQESVDADPEAFVSGFLDFAGYEPHQMLIVDGLRHESVLTALIRYTGQRDDRVSVAFVDVDDSTRFERLKERGLSEGEIAKIENHPSEWDVLHSLRAKATVLLDGEGDVDQQAVRLLEAARAK